MAEQLAPSAEVSETLPTRVWGDVVADDDRRTSDIDWSTTAPAGKSMRDVLEVLEPVPDGMIGSDGKFGTMQALATHLFRKSGGRYSVRKVDGVPTVVELRRDGLEDKPGI